MKIVEDHKCVDGSSSYNCRTETVHSFGQLPEVLTFNLNWNGDPMPGDILKLMVAVPIEFNSNELVTNKTT